jgi:hypothetical protein
VSCCIIIAAATEIFKLSENPTIGILLCTDKNDAVVKITLPENNNNIIASKYQLYLPTEKQLIEEVKKRIENLDTELGEKNNENI